MNLQQNLAIRLLRVLRYNKVRNERALELLPFAQRPVFQVLPFLLHVNHPAFPGYVDDPRVPFGLNNYSLRQNLKTALYRLFHEQTALLDDMRSLWPTTKDIDSLVLMGSTGTIAQTDDSDFDFWVCFDPVRFDEHQIALLNQKLRLIEQWAASHEMEVHFFASNIERVKRNDFGEADGESSGSAQAVFLKAEFYTTNLVVAGKAPFWWLMPEKTSDSQYDELMLTLERCETPDPNWFMDLGNIEKMDPNELFGSAIWQISKAMDSPFKSVLKMAKLEVFLENLETQQPLCNTLKKRVHNGVKGQGGLEHCDPYALMFDEVIDYYTGIKRNDIVELLQICLYIKCECRLSVPPESGERNFKRRIIASYVSQWGWSDAKVRKLDRLKYWNFNELSRLSRQIHSYLITCYRRMSSKLKQDEQLVSKQDMTVLGRKLDAYYSKKPNKIEHLRSAFEQELYQKTVTVKADLDRTNQRSWSLYAGDRSQCRDEELSAYLLKSADNPIDLIVWAISNRVMDGKTDVLLGYQTEPLVEEDLEELADVVQDLFPPIKVSELPREQLLSPSRIFNCLIVVNYLSRRQKADVESVDVIYSTSWGEIYHVSGLDALQSMRFDLTDVQPSANVCVIAMGDNHKSRLYKDLAKRADMEFENCL